MVGVYRNPPRKQTGTENPASLQEGANQAPVGLSQPGPSVAVQTQQAPLTVVTPDGQGSFHEDVPTTDASAEGTGFYSNSFRGTSSPATNQSQIEVILGPPGPAGMDGVDGTTVLFSEDEAPEGSPAARQASVTDGDGVTTIYQLAGSGGSGFALVDNLDTPATPGEHVRVRSDLRGYIQGDNAFLQVDGLPSIQLVAGQEQTNDIDTTDFTIGNDWQEIPQYFQGGGDY